VSGVSSMTITLAVRARDKIYVGADSRSHTRTNEPDLFDPKPFVPAYEPSTTPSKKIIPLQELSGGCPESSKDSACTISGSANLAPIYQLREMGFLDPISPDLPQVMACVAVGSDLSKLSKCTSAYMLVGFDQKGKPFSSRNKRRSIDLVVKQGSQWKPSFSQPYFGLEINGVDSVIDWVFRAHPKQLIKLNRMLEEYVLSPADRNFVRDFASEIKELKRRNTAWDELNSADVVRLTRGFLRITSILNTEDDIQMFLRGGDEFHPLDYSGPPYAVGYVAQGSGWKWRIKLPGSARAI